MTVELAPERAPTLAAGDHRLSRYAMAWLLGYASERTRRAYGRDLAGYVAWCTEQGVDPLAAERAHLDAFARHLERNEECKPTTIARKLASLSSFYGYLVAEDALSRSPVEHVRRPKVSADHTPTLGLDRDEARALIRAATEQSPRAKALVTLLLANGLRVDEALSLDAADLDSMRGHRVVRVRGKGERVDVVPLAPATVSAIEEHLAGRRDGPMFATGSGKRLDQPAVFRLLRRLAQRAGITSADKISPHSLRHTAITAALDAGASLRDVQDFARHADPRTTRRYDRSRHNLDRHATYTVASYLAE